MTTNQREALNLLTEALAAATDSGLFDDQIPAYINPDIINAFCDGVSALEQDCREVARS